MSVIIIGFSYVLFLEQKKIQFCSSFSFNEQQKKILINRTQKMTTTLKGLSPITTTKTRMGSQAKENLSVGINGQSYYCMALLSIMFRTGYYQENYLLMIVLDYSHLKINQLFSYQIILNIYDFFLCSSHISLPLKVSSALPVPMSRSNTKTPFST